MWRVVIAEDEMLLALILRGELEARGVAVVGTALGGGRALALCRETRPDAVLMDLRMPQMDGIEATRRIMAECPTRVVVLTAMDADETRARAKQAGAAIFLTKPATTDEILAALQPGPPPTRCRQ